MEDFHWCLKYILLLSLVPLPCLYQATSMRMEYKVYYIRKDRKSAKDYCLSQNYPGLAILDTQAKMDALWAQSGFDRKRRYWIGLIQGNRSHPRKDTFVWESATATSWANWYSADPNHLKEQFCVRTFDPYQHLGNKECDEKVYFVCEPSWPVTTVATPDTTETIILPSGYYPTIHKDQNLQGSYPELVVLMDNTRSEIECVTLCAKDASCKYVIFMKDLKHCTMYSPSLKDQSDTLKTEIGTNIREKRVE